jgi:hypothetical protein
LFCIYWVESLPLTIIVILLWTVWYRWSVNQYRIEDEQQRGKGAIFGALDGSNDQMEMEFEFAEE